MDSLPGRMDIDFSAGPVRCTLIHDIVRHARHLTEVGGEDTVCLGTDFDGIEPFLELKDASQMPKLADAMKKGGFIRGTGRKNFQEKCRTLLERYAGIIKQAFFPNGTPAGEYSYCRCAVYWGGLFYFVSIFSISAIYWVWKVSEFLVFPSYHLFCASGSKK